MEGEFLKLEKLNNLLRNKLYGQHRSWVVILSEQYKDLFETKQFKGYYSKESEVDNTINFRGLNGDTYKFVLINVDINDIGIYLEQ
jgi:hypothetical protein